MSRASGPTGLWLGQVKGIDGYVVLTDARLVFVIGLRHQKGSPAPWQRRLDELAGAEITSHHWKAALAAALARLPRHAH